MSRPHAAQPSARVVLEAMHVAEWGTQRYRTAISRDSEHNGLAMSGIIFWLFRGNWAE